MNNRNASQNHASWRTRSGRLASAALLAGALLMPGYGIQALATECPAVTAADDKGITGKYAYQFELSEF
jgi:hypothetical protein